MSSGWRGVMSNSLPKIGSVAGNNDNLGSNQSSGEGSKIFFAQVERILHGNDFNKGAIRIKNNFTFKGGEWYLLTSQL